MIKISIEQEDRISQGDIFKDVEIIHRVVEQDGALIVERILYPYVVVVTQDCDLEQDKKNRDKIKEIKTQSEKVIIAKENVKQKSDKILLSVIVLPLYNKEHFETGDHLSELGMEMVNPKNVSKSHLNIIMNNNNERYHYLDFGDETSIPKSIIDFKHYFTVNIEYLLQMKNKNWICKVSELYREQLSNRFAYYLSRIGLPSE